MMSHRTTRLLLTALAVFALSACGGDDEDTATGGEGEGATETPETPAVEAPPPVVAQVCNADGHTCVMRATGEVYCAGKNLDGQLGDGTAQTRWSWVPVQGVSGATSIACGSEHTCAITGSGVFCWGKNESGALGAGNQDATHSAVQVAGLTDATQIALGDDFSCARRTSGAVSCWGEGSGGRLGNGATEVSSSPVAVSGLADAVEVTAGRAHACALKADGTVQCWGAGSNGQLGQGGGERPSDSNVPALAVGVAAASHVAAGGNHTCAITPGGVMCWGQSRYGQAGGEPESNVTVPGLIAGLTGATQLALATNRSCALVADGAVQCWGYNNYTAQLLGVGSEEQMVTTPTAVSGVTGILRFDTSASGTSGSACGLNAAGALFCWGTAGSGRFGNGEPRSLQTAAAVVPNVNALEAPASVPSTFPPAEGPLTARTSFQVGSHTVCGVRDGQAICFGPGSEGRLGNGSTRAQPAASATGAAGITDAVQVATGLTRTCALRRGGDVACWGKLGSRLETSLPIPIEGFAGITTIDVGGSRDSMTVCGVTGEGGVMCAGSALGANAEPNFTATAIEGLTEITDVLVATSSACALQASGKVFCWGSGSYGQMGNGEMDRQATPVEVSGIRDATAIGGGGYNHCALRRNGSVMCWGSGDDGQLTNGNTGREANSATPVAVRGLRGVASLSKMGDSMCAVLRSGEAMCWGANDFGQTGHEDADTDDVTTPWSYMRTHDEAVGALGALVEIGCGWNFCCGLHAEGGISCAGSTPLGGSSGFFGLANQRSTTPIAAPGMTVPVVAAAE